MASDLLSNNFLKSTWVVSRAPFYNKGNNRVYWAYHTQVSSFTTKELTDLSSGNIKNVIQFFNEQNLFTTTELILDPQTLTKVGYCGPESVELNTNKEGGAAMDASIIAERFYIAPRPGAKLKILYSIPAKYINLKKVEYLRARENAEFLKPPSKPRFGQDGWWETSNKDLQDDLLKGVGKIDELNKYFKRKLSTNQKYISKTAGILGRFQNPPETAADNLARMSSARDPSTLAGNYNESLQAVDFVGDFFFEQMPDFLGDVEEIASDAGFIVDTSGSQEALKKAQDASAAAAKELNKIVVFLNKWGLTGLLECLIALTAEKLSLAGYIVVAQKLIEQAEELLESYKMFKAQLEEVDAMVAAFIARMRATQEFDLEKEIKAAFVGMLQEALRQIVQMALAACLEELASEQPASDFDFGALTPGKSFGPSFNASPYDPSNSFDVVLNRDLGVTPEQMGGGGAENQKNNIKGFIVDVYETLTPKELCRLFLGSPEPKLVAFVFSFAESYKYPKFKGYADVKSFFLALGKLSNLTICEDLMMAAPLAMGDPLYCDTGKLDPFTEQLRDKVPDDLLQNMSKQRNEDLLNTANLLEQFLSGEDPFASSYPSIEMGPFYDPIWTRIKKVIPSWEGVFNEDLKSLKKLADTNIADSDELSAGQTAMKEAFPDADLPDINSTGAVTKLNAHPQIKALALVDKLPPLPSKASVIGQTTFINTSALNHANSSMTLDFENFQVQTFHDAKGKQHKKFIMADPDLKKLVEKELDPDKEFKTATDLAFDTTATPAKGKWPAEVLNISNILKESMKATPYEAEFKKELAAGGSPFQKSWWNLCFAIYKDLYFQIYSAAVNDFYTNYDKHPGISSILKMIPYFGSERINKLGNQLCNLKENKDQSKKVLYNEDLLLDLEALKSLIYILVIENSLPIFLAGEMIPYNTSFVMIETEDVIVPLLEKFIENHNLIIPFNQILCDSVDNLGKQLTLNTLVFQETENIITRLGLMAGVENYEAAKVGGMAIKTPEQFVQERLLSFSPTGKGAGTAYEMTLDPKALGEDPLKQWSDAYAFPGAPIYNNGIKGWQGTYYLWELEWANPANPMEKLGFLGWMVSNNNPVYRDWNRVLESDAEFFGAWDDARNILQALKTAAAGNGKVKFGSSPTNVNLVYWFLIKSLNFFLRDIIDQGNTFFPNPAAQAMKKFPIKWGTNTFPGYPPFAGYEALPDMLVYFSTNFKHYVTLKSLGVYNSYKLLHTNLDAFWEGGPGNPSWDFYVNILLAKGSILTDTGDASILRIFSKERDLALAPAKGFIPQVHIYPKWNSIIMNYYGSFAGGSPYGATLPEEDFANLPANIVITSQLLTSDAPFPISPKVSNMPIAQVSDDFDDPKAPTFDQSFNANEMATVIKLEIFDALNEVLTNKQGFSIFQKFKATLVEFIGGIPFNKENQYAETKEQLKFALNELKGGPGSFAHEMDSTPLWIMILMLFPKIIIAGIKSIIETYLFMQAPIVYFLLKTLESLGFDLADSDSQDLLSAADKHLKSAEKDMGKNMAAKYPHSAAAQEIKKQQQQLEKLKCPLP